MKSDDLSRLKIDRTAQGGSAVRRRRSWVRYGVAAVLVATLLAWVGSRFAAPPAVETVTVASVYPSQNYTMLNAAGYVVPERKAALSSKASGRLEWLGVLEGSRVQANEVIARLESNDVRASLAQASAQVRLSEANLQQGLAELADAEGNFRRSSELLSKKFISGAQNDTDLMRLRKAQAAIASHKAAVASSQANRWAAEVAVEQTVIRAPFDAIVLTKNADVGDNITPFSSAAGAKGAVVTVADMNTLEVEADVAESNIGKLKVGQPCEVQLDALPELRLSAVVSRIVPTVDRAKATVLVKVRFVDKDARVLPDMSAKVAFLEKPVAPEEKQPLAAVQPKAIIEREGRTIAFVVKDDRARSTEVTTGRKLGELVEVRGLRVGDRVVLSPGEKVRDGGAVSVTKK
ncbi:MAG TPA: efflux RND transporter periplasmic adaptor subunit [Burkholderiales bacterium]|nr:efflux RND transporter periplasmic adaptor subunit [Burkholderiales bacterium]